MHPVRATNTSDFLLWVTLCHDMRLCSLSVPVCVFVLVGERGAQFINAAATPERFCHVFGCMEFPPTARRATSPSAGCKNYMIFHFSGSAGSASICPPWNRRARQAKVLRELMHGECAVQELQLVQCTTGKYVSAGSVHQKGIFARMGKSAF
jgi:hypothetical protein